MSIRLTRTVTAARLAANRRSALKSTGPRTEAGKRRSSLNALRPGSRSKADVLFWKALMMAPAGQVLQTADRLMTREQRLHYEDVLEILRFPREVEDEARRRKATLTKKLKLKSIRSKPKTPLLSVRDKDNPGIYMKTNRLSYQPRNIIDK
jgi:hypothetical protein